ncbi:hypothetical protein [uncultured Duncaniella sp.]|uniref:hypothetical protein n=1 Tax=uncultured Duncaniella sp. TaxID=2768039 RepID=UPI0025EA1158|nr:hypothetical protein [uncultured Duncaniella sp.]
MNNYNKLFTILSAVIIFFITSCNKEDNEPFQDNPEPQIEYYVKYEFKFGSYRNLARVAHVSVTTESGSKSFDLKPSNDWWEGTFGPFKQCKNLILQGTADGSYPNLHMQGRISISTGGPFVLKAQGDEYTKSLQIKYNTTSFDLK